MNDHFFVRESSRK